MQRRWQERADETVARIAETADRRKSVDQAQRQTAKLGREMREDWESTVLQARKVLRLRGLKIVEGARVRLKGIRDIARVSRMLGHDRLEVAVGFVKMQVALSDVEEVLAESGAPEPKLPKNVRLLSGPQLNPGEQEINVIGEHVEEASGAGRALSGCRGDGDSGARAHCSRAWHGGAAAAHSGFPEKIRTWRSSIRRRSMRAEPARRSLNSRTKGRTCVQLLAASLSGRAQTRRRVSPSPQNRNWRVNLSG